MPYFGQVHCYDVRSHPSYINSLVEQKHIILTLGGYLYFQNEIKYLKYLSHEQISTVAVA